MFKRFLKVFTSFFIIFILVFVGANLYINNADNYVKPTGNYSNDSPDSISFLLMGVDVQDSKKNSNLRADTLMVFNVNKSSGKISILSIPRDTRTAIEGRKYKEKINHAYAYGGPELTLKTVSNLLNINLDYYVVVDYKFVEEFVDIIGGVEVEVPMDMKYEDPVADPPLYIDLKAGLQTLDGDEAMQFLRFRKGYKNADLGRIDAQQSFMTSLVKETLRFKNVIKAPLIYKVYNENVDTNIPLNTIVKYGLKFNKYDLANMNSEVLPGSSKMMNGISYYVHSEDKTEKLIKEMFPNYNDFATMGKINNN